MDTFPRDSTAAVSVFDTNAALGIHLLRVKRPPVPA
jgi:hypothetical protein